MACNNRQVRLIKGKSRYSEGGKTINLPVPLLFCHLTPPLPLPSLLLCAQMNGGNVSESVERCWAFA